MQTRFPLEPLKTLMKLCKDRLPTTSHIEGQRVVSSVAKGSCDKSAAVIWNPHITGLMIHVAYVIHMDQDQEKNS